LQSQTCCKRSRADSGITLVQEFVNDRLDWLDTEIKEKWSQLKNMILIENSTTEIVYKSAASSVMLSNKAYRSAGTGACKIAAVEF
jgi:hypothetical protein